MRSLYAYLTIVMLLYASYLVDSFALYSPPASDMKRQSVSIVLFQKQQPSDKAFSTGGALDQQEGKAAKLAAGIRSVQDLGWTQLPKRRGSIRPRHRAFGGSTERHIQLKPNYDESNPACVEKWLTEEEFYNRVNDSSPAADTVFVALAGGCAFAERDVAEQVWQLGLQMGNNLTKQPL